MRQVNNGTAVLFPVNDSRLKSGVLDFIKIFEGCTVSTSMTYDRNFDISGIVQSILGERWRKDEKPAEAQRFLKLALLVFFFISG